MKFGKRLMSMALALVMIFGLTTGASAAASQTVTAKLSPDITVKLGNETQAMADANGNPVYPILYNGTTYLPIRAIAGMLKLEVVWSRSAGRLCWSAPVVRTQRRARLRRTPRPRISQCGLTPASLSSITAKPRK